MGPPLGAEGVARNIVYPFWLSTKNVEGFTKNIIMPFLVTHPKVEGIPRQKNLLVHTSHFPDKSQPAVVHLHLGVGYGKVNLAADLTLT